MGASVGTVCSVEYSLEPHLGHGEWFGVSMGATSHGTHRDATLANGLSRGAMSTN